MFCLHELRRVAPLHAHSYPRISRHVRRGFASVETVRDIGEDHNRLRRNAAQFIPLWLRQDPSFQQGVFRRLKLTTEKQTALYDDSIPSFIKRLKEGPPPNLYESLDRMVEAGLSNPRLARDYRSHTWSKAQVQRFDASLAEQQNRIQFHGNQVEQYQKEIDQLTQSITASATNSSVDDSKLRLLNERLEQNKAVVETSRNTIELIEARKQSKMALSDAESSTIQTLSAAVQDNVVQAFAEHVRDRHSQILEQFQSLDARTDLTRPHDWFLRARMSKRKIIYHGGPTNSGKTYMALERLKQAKTGMYYGPLRLLAAEVYEKLTTEGVYCNLVTGQESREIPFATHGSATVEMAYMKEDFDVVVIDEIQMIGDAERGYAWTKALLGSRCPEIHVCGGLEAVDVVQRMAKACGDEFELKSYSRFSDLQVADSSLSSKPDAVGSYKNVREGDCVVAFSIGDIFAIKREIERKTKFKCCVIYGSLPPSTRSEQARRFNDPESGYDILVASDAIGMGLNLNIRRVVFNSILKNNGIRIVRLTHSQVKQISGRAGRRNSPFPVGEVTTRDPRDLEYLHQCLQTEIEPVQSAGLVPTGEHIETFSETLEYYGLGHKGPQNLYTVLRKFNEMANLKSDYFLCRRTPILEIAKHISDVSLSIPDKFILCLCPVSTRSGGSIDIMKSFAAKLAAGEVAGLNNSSVPKPPRHLDDLASLCNLFNEIELFLWLQRKFPPGNIMEQQAANTRRDLAIQYIGQGLAESDKLRIKQCYIRRERRLRNTWTTENQKAEQRKGRNKNLPRGRHSSNTSNNSDGEETDEDEWY